jgi:hypothetical protein
MIGGFALVAFPMKRFDPDQTWQPAEGVTAKP